MQHSSRNRLSTLLSLLLIAPQTPSALFAQGAAASRKAGTNSKSVTPPKFALTIDNIMRGPGLTGYEPSAIRWSYDASKLYFQWKRYTDPIDAPMDTYVINRDGSDLRKLSDEEAKLAPPVANEQGRFGGFGGFGGGGAGELSKDRKWTVYTQSGDLVLYDNEHGVRRQLTKTGDVESQPHFLHHQANQISFVRGGNLFVLSLDASATQPMLDQLTDIQSGGAAGTAPAAARGGGRRATAASDEEKKGTESQEYLKREERALLEVINERAKLREELEAKRKKENPRKPYMLAARQSVTTLQLSPDGKYVIAGLSDIGEGSKNNNVQNFVTESTYTEEIPSRNLVGDTQSHTRFGFINVMTGEVKMIDPGQTMKAINPKTKEETTHPRPIQFGAQPVWNEAGTLAVVIGRSTDNKDRWIFSVDPATGKTKVIFADHDDAWIGGPGMFTLGWMKNDHDIFFESEKSGFSQLYTISADGSEVSPRQLTTGKFEVLEAQLSADKSTFYLTTSEVSPFERHFYSMPAEGGARTKITSMPGSHRAILSHDEQWIADVYSYTNKPPELFVMPNRPGAQEAKLTNSPAPDFWEYPWLDVPIIEFTARDGVKVPARFYKPADFKPGGPAVVFVHGAGYTQNVHKYWASYSHEYMFHHFLMEHGYAVLDIDYRASSGYGREWRTSIYRFMGGKDLDDQVDGAQWLIVNHGVNPKKIGIYGGSYGGFITLMALFTQPGVFAAGAALRPVTDWAHYNHGYTSNILNEPQNDAEAYKKSSPIYYASGLQGALLICHGMVDTNVHFQDTVRLVQKLIELRKDNWSVAPYPVEDHGFVQPSSWADEYKRIFKLFEQNLKN
ncbi:MAG TPA: prolyl oligopeptidase family serine peptidase [Bryobacteraceae bacterium]